MHVIHASAHTPRVVFMQSVSNHVPWKARRKESRTKHSVSRMTSEWQSESPALAEQESSPCEFCAINPTLSVCEISQSVGPRHWSLELVVSFALSLPPLVTESDHENGVRQWHILPCVNALMSTLPKLCKTFCTPSFFLIKLDCIFSVLGSFNNRSALKVKKSIRAWDDLEQNVHIKKFWCVLLKSRFQENPPCQSTAEGSRIANLHRQPPHKPRKHWSSSAIESYGQIPKLWYCNAQGIRTELLQF